MKQRDKGPFEFHAPAQWQRYLKQGLRARIYKMKLAIENERASFSALSETPELDEE